jgi:prenyltransferase beta subunit
MRRTCALCACLALWLTGNVASPEAKKQEPKKEKDPAPAARAKGLEWLTKNQAKDGSWGKTYTIAVTSFACLAYLAAADEPFDGAHAKALTKALEYLLSHQKDGMYTKQGHSWIHGQGFATLALSEAFGRALLCKVKPDLDMKRVKEAVEKGVVIIGKNQSNSGGWWYEPNSPGQHEGSTTVCAVQALVSAKNFEIPIDEKVLDKGFEYLKKCQTKEGGFNYQLGDGRNMKEGTCAAVATLGLMQKFDFQVMINGYNFMLKTTPEAIGKEQWPEYGYFYGVMGMHLLWQEYKVDKKFAANTKTYIAAVHKDLSSWQQADGSYPVKAWVAQNENNGYSTAFSTMVLGVTDSRLSIYNRDSPKLPKKEK